MENRFYVYGYIRLDTNTYFYIGKGTRKRYLNYDRRTSHFKNIVNKVPCVVEIIKDNLTEEEAYTLERAIIEILVFEEGYSIEIKDYCDRNIGMHLVNQSFGGEGSRGFKQSDECKAKMSEQRKGKNNAFYGKVHSDYTKSLISEKMLSSGCVAGKNNWMYGKKGELCPSYGRKHSEDELNKMSWNSPLRKGVYCYELDLEFPSLTKAETYMLETYHIKFCRKKLSKALKIDGIYGELEIDGVLTQLHWKYTTLND